MKHITDRQQEVLDFIIKYKSKHIYSPTIREIADGLGVTTHAAKQNIVLLCKKKALDFTPHIARSIIVLKDGNK